MAAAVVCGVAAGAGCVSMHGGAFEATGYRSTYGYELPYERGTQQLLPDDWTLVNYDRTSGGGWTRKNLSHDLTDYEFDEDDARSEVVQGFTYAVRYEHRVHAGVIWLRDIPLEAKLRSKDLRVLMQTYIDQFAGAIYEPLPRSTTMWQQQQPQIVVEHRRAAAVLEEGPAVVAGQPAYAATIEVANLDEVRVAPRARTSQIQLVLLRAPQDEVYDPGNVRDPPHRHPMLVLAAYSNMPVDFSKGLEDFHRLLRRIAIGGKTGLSLDLVPAAPAPAGGPPPPAAAPADLAPAPPPAQPQAARRSTHVRRTHV
jgi:hypothetical protein